MRRPDESSPLDGQKSPTARQRTPCGGGVMKPRAKYYSVILPPTPTDLDFRFASILHPKSIDP